MIDFIENTILNGQVRLLQPVKGYRAAIDPIFLAACVHPHKSEKIADLGCGVGTIGFCLNHFHQDITLHGYDIQTDLIDLAIRNTGLNSAQDNFNFFNESIERIKESDFNRVVINPPYYEDGANIPSPLPNRATAHSGTLDIWLEVAAKILKKGGYLNLIVPALRYEDVRKLCRKYQFGAIEIVPIFSKIDKPAKRLIFQARLHKSGETLFHRGLVVHEENGDYTQEAQEILYGVRKLPYFKKD